MSNVNIARCRPATGVLSILTLACFGLAACGGSSGTSTNAAATSAASTPTSASTSTPASTSPSTHTSTSTPQPNGQGQVAAGFTARRECLRKSGITLPNPTSAARGGSHTPLGAGVQLPKGMTHAQYEAALRRCGGAGFLGGGPRLNNPVFTRALAKYAECLRQNGVNIPLPNTSGKGPLLDTSGVKTSSPQFRAATLKCRATLIGAFRGLSPAGGSPRVGGSAPSGGSAAGGGSTAGGGGTPSG
jgi:hypothetical protein